MKGTYRNILSYVFTFMVLSKIEIDVNAKVTNNAKSMMMWVANYHSW